MEDGALYEGDFTNDMVEGNGKYTDANKNIFKSSKNGQGFFKNGRLQKKGKAEFKNGDIYKGFFKDGCFDGEGKMTYKHISFSNFSE